MSQSTGSVDQVQVQALAKLLHEGHREQLFQRVGKLEYDSAKFEAFFTSLHSESDRALAIVAFSFIDEQLKELLIRAMDLTSVGGAEPLFGSLGPLATASARIKLAAALRWIDPKLYRDLDLIRKIRNEFAHNPFLRGFDQPRITGFMSSMQRIEEVFCPHLEEGARDPKEFSARERFHVRCIAGALHMVAQVLTAPIALGMGLDPSEALRLGGKEWPPPLNELVLAAAGAMGTLIDVSKLKVAKQKEPDSKN